MIRYNRLGYVALNVTDVDKSADFYRDVVGLQQVDGPDPICRYLRCGDKHHDIVLYPGNSPGLKRIGFEVESDEQMASLRRVLTPTAIGWRSLMPEECDKLAVTSGIRAWEPATGCAIDFYPSMAASHAERFEPTVTNIARLGHLVLRSPDFQRTLGFFQDLLNFKVSDFIDGRIAFMRCFPNPYHHSLGVGNGSGKKANLNHVNFMVTDVDDIGKAMWRLQKHGSTIVNGPGRHKPSGSMFLYFLDPDGITVEFSFGMEEFAEHEDARDPRVLPVEPESFDLWLGPVHEKKAAVGTIEDSRETAPADR